ncbi:hypothetical protein T484DRAFT_1819188 [Baffinella frigidus]|nr:hypothetical protein T484DRAFT_1819188 [Cryptophyta sp. CCMP2293]
MEDELRAMLGEISREEKAVVARVGVAEALKEMATCSPLIARAFIEPDLLSEDLLSASLDLLGSKECAQELEAPLQEVVTAVVAAAGLYPRHAVTPSTGGAALRWSPAAPRLLHLLEALLTPRPPPFMRRKSSSATSVTRAPLEPPREFLVFDGGFAGVFLGGSEAWTFSSGVSWDAWILWEGGRGGADMVLFRLVSNEELSGRQSVVTETLLRGSNLVVVVGEEAKRQEVLCSLLVPEGVWTHVHVSHDCIKLSTSLLK